MHLISVPSTRQGSNVILFCFMRCYADASHNADDFTASKRLGLRGLLPSQVMTFEGQIERVMNQFYKEKDPFRKYQQMRDLHDRQVLQLHLFRNVSNAGVGALFGRNCFSRAWWCVRNIGLKLTSTAAHYRDVTSIHASTHLFYSDRNETLFHRVCLDYIKDVAPIIYTPTVGEACIEFGHDYRRARGMYVEPLPFLFSLF